MNLQRSGFQRLEKTNSKRVMQAAEVLMESMQMNLPEADSSQGVCELNSDAANWPPRKYKPRRAAESTSAGGCELARGAVRAAADSKESRESAEGCDVPKTKRNSWPGKSGMIFGDEFDALRSCAVRDAREEDAAAEVIAVAADGNLRALRFTVRGKRDLTPAELEEMGGRGWSVATAAERASAMEICAAGAHAEALEMRAATGRWLDCARRRSRTNRASRDSTSACTQSFRTSRASLRKLAARFRRVSSKLSRVSFEARTRYSTGN